MCYLFIISFVFLILQMCLHTYTKKLTGLNIVAATGIYLPLFLYMLDWSHYMDAVPCDEFYLIFLYVNICLIIYNMLITERIAFNCDESLSGMQFRNIDAINIIFITLYFLESFIGSGTIVPALHNIDIHTYSAPIISFVTRNLAVPALFDVAAYRATRKKRYILWTAAIIALPVLSRSARMISLSIVLKVLMLVAILFVGSRGRRRKKGNQPLLSRLLNTRVLYLMVAILIVAASAWLVVRSANVSNIRGSHYGEYEFDYSKSIGYNGPDTPGDVLAIYYGYFPMSFGVLNQSLKATGAASLYGNNPIGLYSFACVWFGLLQFDNIFDIPSNLPDSLVTYTTASAIVPTGFWTFWYDYGVFCLLPIAVMFFICGVSYKSMLRSKSLLSVFYYINFVSGVFLESFQNTFFSSAMIWGLLLFSIVEKVCIYHEE